jgi:hypothetical protein
VQAGFNAGDEIAVGQLVEPGAERGADGFEMGGLFRALGRDRRFRQLLRSHVLKGLDHADHGAVVVANSAGVDRQIDAGAPRQIAPVLGPQASAATGPLTLRRSHPSFQTTTRPSRSRTNVATTICSMKRIAHSRTSMVVAPARGRPKDRAFRSDPIACLKGKKASLQPSCRMFRPIDPSVERDDGTSRAAELTLFDRNRRILSRRAHESNGVMAGVVAGALLFLRL